MNSWPKLLASLTGLLFIIILIASFFKSDKTSTPEVKAVAQTNVVEINLNQVPASPPKPVVKPAPPKPAVKPIPVVKPQPVVQTLPPPEPIISVPQQPAPSVKPAPAVKQEDLPEANRIEQLFSTGDNKLSIVETITYRSRVPWMKGRPAWLSDYAQHYETSRHFIARSLNGKPDYFDQEISEGDRFNVFRSEKPVSFYLVIDTSRCKMWFYSLDGDTKQRVLLKTYPVSLGRVESNRASGILTPHGKYTLGNRIAIYKPKIMGYYQGQKIEMMRVFGTRWIPFDKELEGTEVPAKGFGIHGVPWQENSKGELAEDATSIGKYQSDGCIRLATPDMEELFAIIITKPTIVELVKDFRDAKLPGKE